MNEEKIAKMSDAVAEGFSRIAAPDEDDALANVDQALDTIIAATQVIDDNLPKVKTTNTPEAAAVDVIKDVMDNAIKPYMADALKAMQVFGG